MTATTKLGVWMDHSSAHIMEFTTDPIETVTLSSDFTQRDKENGLERSESHMHNKENHKHAAYYKKLGEIIGHYKEVILFGPTDAKTELHNLLLADPLFAEIKIEVQNTDKMTENQQHAFVKKHFSRHALTF